MDRRLIATITVFFVAICPVCAGATDLRATDLAPNLASMTLRGNATAALAAAVASLPAPQRARVVGIYVAFDDDPSEVNATAACDDDGDYVVVLTEAILRLADHVSRARSVDEARGTHLVDGYAELLATSQKPGARLLPPPPGFFDAADDADPEIDRLRDERLRGLLTVLVMRELLHAARGDLTCPHPTATKEPGDDVWTSAERRAGLVVARQLAHEARCLERDAEATRLARARGRGEDGFLALLAVFARAERSGGALGKLHGELHASAARRERAVRVATAEETAGAL